jgi:hypothetical protein
MTITGSFEQIKSLETPYVYAEGNNGASITANTDINFTEVEDASGLWTNNTTYSPNEDGWYFITGSTGATASHQGTFYIHDGTSTLFFLAPNNLSANVKPFQGIVYLEAAKSYTFRATATFTANNNSQVHRIYIQKWVDTGTLIKNLNDNKNVKCQTKILSADTSSVAEILDLQFTGLTIGKKYKAKLHGYISSTALLATRHDGDILMRLYVSGGASLIATSSTPIFTATNTTLNTSNEIAATTFGNGTLGETWVELCELPDNYIETTEF